jgi:uncharacterized protein
VPRLTTAAVSILVLLATAGAWFLLDPLPWPARALTTLLLVPLPALLTLQGRLAGDLPPDADREAVYVSSALSVWVLATLAMGAARFSGFDRPELRLAGVPLTVLLAATSLTVLAGVGAMALARVLRFQETPLVHFLIPRSGSEKIAFVGLSVSAGIAEELVFRSFLIAAVFRASGSLHLAVLVSVIVFAVSHAYQGWTGILRVGFLGIILTIPFLVTGSVYPSILAHAALDILAGLVLARWLVGEAGEP